MNPQYKRLLRWTAALLVAIACVCVLFQWSARRSAMHTPGPSEPARTADPYQTPREHMVTYDIEQRGVRDPDVLRAVRAVPRHEFVLPEYLNQAYADHPLPISYGQTITQPYIVAVMSDTEAPPRP